MKEYRDSLTTAGEMPRRFRPAAIFILFVILMAVASIPIATHPLLPLTDYSNHLARTYVIGAIDSDPYLARYYTIDWQFLPNLMIDLVVPVLHLLVGIYPAGQIFTMLAFVLISSGALALNRALFGHWSVTPLIALPLLYNGVLLVGVMNYVFGIGLALWALAAWVMLRERHWLWRMSVSTLFVLLLYVCHLFAAGLYGLGLLALELHRLWSRRDQPWMPRLIDFVATGLPFLPFLALLVASSTWQAPGSPLFWELSGKIEGLMLVFNLYYPAVGFGLAAIAVIAAVIAYRRRLLQFHPAGWFILGTGVVIYLAMPRAIFAAHLADQRLPIALAFMLIACFEVQWRTRAIRTAFVALVAVLLMVRIAVTQAVWDHLELLSDDFLQSVQLIKRGARVLVVHGDRDHFNEISDRGLAHAASLATIERSALVTTAFTVKGKHILHVRPPFRKFVETEDRLPPSIPYFVETAERANIGAPQFWDFWPKHYDYVYILFTMPGAPNPAARHLQMISSGRGFQLYQVK